jgi:hypothetical protein
MKYYQYLSMPFSDKKLNCQKKEIIPVPFNRHNQPEFNSLLMAIARIVIFESLADGESGRRLKKADKESLKRILGNRKKMIAQLMLELYPDFFINLLS